MLHVLSVGKKQVAFEAVALPDLHPEPEVGATEVTFFQTAGGRTGVPAPRRVRRAPFVQFSAPLAWTTLALTLRADGTSSFAMTGGSSFPRHWVYGGDNKLALKSGMIDFSQWYRRAFGKHSPWGDQDSQALTTEVETALERQLSLTLMQGGAKPKIRTVKPGAAITEQGAAEDDIYPRARRRGAHRGRRRTAGRVRAGVRCTASGAILEGGRRTSTIRAVTACKLAVAGAENVDRDALAELSSGHRREDKADHRVALTPPARALGRPAVDDVDAVVIGSGPNGLVAATLLARAGWSVTVLERSAVAGGAVHSAELTVPGYVHDTYSAFYGLLHCSPVLGELGLDTGVAWAHFDSPVAAAVSPHQVAVVHRDPEHTAAGLARRAVPDGPAWAELYRWWRQVGTYFLAQMLEPVGAPGPGLAFARRARREGLWTRPRCCWARSKRCVPIAWWTRPRGPAGRRRVARGRARGPSRQRPGRHHPRPGGPARRHARARGGRRSARRRAGRGRHRRRRRDPDLRRGHAGGGGAQPRPPRWRPPTVPPCGPGTPCSPTPARRALFHGLVGSDQLPARYLDGLRRFRYGTGVFKVDLALDGPAPWAEPELASTGVVHLTGDLDAMAHAFHEARRGIVPARPMLIVGQHTNGRPEPRPGRGTHLVDRDPRPSRPA